MILILGYALLVIMLVVVAVDVTAIHLARTQLRDAADAAALDAADAADVATIYGHGVHGSVPLSDDTVRSAAGAYLRRFEAPARLRDVRLGAATGTPDGRTAVVQLTGRAQLPLLGPVVAAWSGGIQLTVESEARADVDQP